MISFTQDKSIYTWWGYFYAVLLLVVAILQSLFLQQYFQRCFTLGLKVRTAIMTVVYKKVQESFTTLLLLCIFKFIIKLDFCLLFIVYLTKILNQAHVYNVHHVYYFVALVVQFCNSCPRF